jgi:hypothetical protein
MEDFENMGIIQMAKTLGEMGDQMKKESPHPSLDSMLEDIFRNFTTDTVLRHMADILVRHRCQCTCENCMECDK